MIFALASGCKSEIQKTAIEIGGGMRKGEPPMCFQYRGEARPAGSATNVFAHLNNTCSYSVDCQLYDDVTEQTRRVVSQPYQSQSVILKLASDTKRVELELECTWKP